MKKVLVALTLMFAVSSVNLYACESCAKHNKDKKEYSSKKSEKECTDADIAEMYTRNLSLISSSLKELKKNQPNFNLNAFVKEISEIENESSLDYIFNKYEINYMFLFKSTLLSQSEILQFINNNNEAMYKIRSWQKSTHPTARVLG